MLCILITHTLAAMVHFKFYAGSITRWLDGLERLLFAHLYVLAMCPYYVAATDGLYPM